MALTQQQWFDKITKFVPSWWFEREKYSTAVFQAIAAQLAALQADSDDQFTATFITQSTTPIEDAHGAERQKTRISGETDAVYAARIQRITSQTDRPDIKALIDSLLLIGPCEIYESPQDNAYCSRSFFCTRRAYLNLNSLNYFLVVVPPQIHAPYSFLTRSAFAARLSFVGSEDSTTTLLTSVIAAINAQKAFGVMFGVLERAS